MKYTAEFGWRAVGLTDEIQDTRFVNVSIGPIDCPVLHSPSALRLQNSFCVFFTQQLASHRIDRIAPLVAFHPTFRKPMHVAICQVSNKSHIDAVAFSPENDNPNYADAECAAAIAIAAFRRRLTGSNTTVAFGNTTFQTAWDGEECLVTSTTP